MIFLVLSMFAGIYVTIREWISLILELWHNRHNVLRVREELPVHYYVCDTCSIMREEPPREEESPTLRRRREDYRHQELGEVSGPELWMELHHHNYPSDSSDRVPIGSAKEEGKGKGLRAKAKPKAKSKPKAKPFPRDQAASGGNRPTQTAGSSAEAGSTAEAAPGQEPEPEEADNPLRDPFANMTPEELAD